MEAGENHCIVGERLDEIIRDVDDPAGKRYGTYLTRESQPPDPEKIKSRWI